MSDSAFKEETQPKPPQGSNEKAAEYISQLTNLINQDKLKVAHTDLSKYDPSNLQDHYRVALKDYMVEVSHAKDANTGRDSFVLLFTNLKNIRDGCNEKLILGYVHLTSDQFNAVKLAANAQSLRIKKQEEDQLFNQNLKPIEEALSELVSGKAFEPATDIKTETPIDSQPTLSSIAQENPKPIAASETAITSEQPVVPAEANMTAPSPETTAPKTPSSFPGM